MEEKTVNAIVNLGQLKVVEKAYDDLLSEPSKKASSALATILNIGNTILWPIKWVNERTRIYFENNLKKYELELQNIEIEKIVNVPTEISMPILERFAYVSNEELSNSFVKLLISASSADTINKAHPGFIQIIDRLSPDEAILLKYLHTENVIPLLGIEHHNDPEDTSIYENILENKTGLEDKISLIFPENISIYLDNLESLGLIRLYNYYYTFLNEEYPLIEAKYANIISKVFEIYDDNKLNQVKKYSKRMYEISHFGKLFIDACIKV